MAPTQAGPPVETAFAMPRTGPVAGAGRWRGNEVGMPRPLSEADATRIRAIFAVQGAGRFEEAAALTRGLHDGTLLGDVLADRFLSPGAHPDMASLRQWLHRWGELPDASAIRQRLSDLSHRRPGMPAAVPAPALASEPPDTAPPEEADPAERAFRRNLLLDRTVQARLAQGRSGVLSALRLVAATRFPGPLYAAMLRAEIARAAFGLGDDALALRTGQAGLRQSAGRIGLAGTVAGLAAWRQGQTGLARDAARFPLPPLRPRQGFIVNPALVYALTRLESNFDTKVVSGAGAHGLMQIMPVTANFVLGAPHRSRDDARALHNPAVNLQIGQRYLAYLAGQAPVGGDLIRLLASYNAGPNALAHWSQGAESGDPLLFIESLPVRESRDFVHRALTYLWIYDARLHLPAPSLDKLAQGGWPRFEDEQRMAGATTETIDASD